MTAAFAIDARTGDVLIGELRLTPHQSKAEIEPQIAHLVKGSRDHGNGYEWLNLGGLSFAGHPAGVGLCFHEGRFEQASWNVLLPDAREEGGWPTREASDDEVAFVRDTLARDIGFDPARKLPMIFGWGEIWSAFDEKGGCASHGLRYRRQHRHRRAGW